MVILNGERVRAEIVGTDFMPDKNDCVTIKDNLKKNHKSQGFKLARISTLQGIVTTILQRMVTTIPKSNSSVYRPVTLTFTSPSEEMGHVNISFYNMCFNFVGFMTHDVAY